MDSYFNFIIEEQQKTKEEFAKTKTQEKIIPDHQFRFHNQNATIHQTHRLVYNIGKWLFPVLETNYLYCSATFSDLEKAIDKLWHMGWLFKIATNF